MGITEGMSLGMASTGMGTITERDYFLSEQVRVFHLDGFIHVPQSYAVAVCVHSCTMVQKHKEQNAPCFSKCCNNVFLCALSDVYQSCTNT